MSGQAWVSGESRAAARKWRLKGAFVVAFGAALEAFAGADVAYSALTSHLSWPLAANVITVVAGAYCINRGLMIRHTWLWALAGAGRDGRR